ncbi:hypothetical protein HOLleu_00996 [Holothuria leucospilota]|uniref:Uncharacterized protein n=1 Tax=Holothuria leucospilota TaxID=206669 RepID=A0A9Q1HKK5_HOLLE|nr:hypothetical protein HOLleu_00996 [Holothuria leucospilota]
MDMTVSRDVRTRAMILKTIASEAYFVWCIHLVVVVTLGLVDSTVMLLVMKIPLGRAAYKPVTVRLMNVIGIQVNV